MRCHQCTGQTRAGRRCGRPASCRKNCPRRCWQHSLGYQKGVGCPARPVRRIAVQDDDHDDVKVSIERKGEEEATSKSRKRPPKGQRSGKSEASSDDESEPSSPPPLRLPKGQHNSQGVTKRLPLTLPKAAPSPLAEKLKGKGLNISNICEFFMNHPYSAPERKEKWQRVLEESADYIRVMYDVPEPEKFVFFNGHALTHMFDLVDKYFFGSLLRPWITEEMNQKLRFTVRWIEDGEVAYGTTWFDKRGYIVVTLRRPDFDSRFSAGQRSYPHNGLRCHSKLECLLQTFAHELIHVMIKIFGSDEYNEEGSHGPTFFKLQRNIFGMQHHESFMLDAYAGSDVYDAEQVLKQWNENKSQKFQFQIANQKLHTGECRILSVNDFLEATIEYRTVNGTTATVKLPLYLIRPNAKPVVATKIH